MSEARIRLVGGEYTTLQNEVVQDRRLSLKTIGLLTVMKSLINTKWEFSVSGMAVYCKVGKDYIRGCLKELEDAGYLLRERTHKENGTFGGNEYVIFETAQKPPVPEDSGHRRKTPTMDKTQRRQKPSSVNQTQIKEITQVKENNTPLPPKGDVTQEILFERFWKAYPRRTAKDKAQRAWRKLKPDIVLCRVMAAALEVQKASEAWTHDGGKYIPHAATWLNGRRWEDEVAVDSQPSAVPEAPRASHIEHIDGEEVVVFD